MRDLLIIIDEGERPRAALERQLREAIRAGRLAAGAMMPSSRALAGDLNIARSTVVAAYEQLAIEGYLIAEHGKATTVAAVATIDDSSDDPNPMGMAYRHDLRPGEPASSSFPRREWQRATRKVLAEAPDAAFGYGDPRGTRELRHALGAYLARVRGVHADVAGVRIYGGHAQALGFIGETLRSQGIERVAVEAAMLFLHRQILEIVGLETLEVPVDEEGIVVDELAGLDLGAVFVTPANNFPFTVTLSSTRRTALLEWAREVDAWVVEDDYDGEFRYDRRPIGSLQGLDPERVLYSGTASKAISPSLRMSWLVVPAALRGRLAAITHLRAGVPTLDQLIVAELLTSGAYDRHVRKQRSVYRRRRDDLIEVLADIGWLDIAPVNAGMHALALLAENAPTEETILEAAEAASIGLLGLQSHLGHHQQGIAIGFSRPADHQIAGDLDALVQLLTGF